VDDEPFNREIFEKMFQSMEFGVQTADSWLTGSKLFDPGRFDLVCLDVVMPGIDGFEVAREIKGVDPAQKVVMMTGLCRDMVEEHAVAYGVDADGYIFKPFTFDGVKVVLHKVLEMDIEPVMVHT
jgi:DNA-binding response OmpR family regulator